MTWWVLNESQGRLLLVLRYFHHISTLKIWIKNLTQILVLAHWKAVLPTRKWGLLMATKLNMSWQFKNSWPSSLYNFPKAPRWRNIKYCELLHVTALLHVAFSLLCHCSVLLRIQNDNDSNVFKNHWWERTLLTYTSFLSFPVKYSSYNSWITALWLYLLEFLASYKSLVSFDTLFLSRTLSQGKL